MTNLSLEAADDNLEHEFRAQGVQLPWRAPKMVSPPLHLALQVAQVPLLSPSDVAYS